MKANYYISAADDVKSDKPARKNDKSKNKLRNRNHNHRNADCRYKQADTVCK